MKNAFETDSGAMTDIPSFIKIGSRIKQLMGGDTQTRRQSHKLNFIVS
jgi:hypothetical protein